MFNAQVGPVGSAPARVLVESPSQKFRSGASPPRQTTTPSTTGLFAGSPYNTGSPYSNANHVRTAIPSPYRYSGTQPNATDEVDAFIATQKEKEATEVLEAAKRKLLLERAL